MRQPGLSDDPIQRVLDGLEAQSYVADPSIATSIYLAGELERPLLVEGRPGVGKTEIAIAMARLLDTNLIRLQCYEGLDVNTALLRMELPQAAAAHQAERAGGAALSTSRNSRSSAGSSY